MVQWYIFTPLSQEELGEIRRALLDIGNTHGMCGLILLAHEGCNGTVAGSKEAMNAIKQYIAERLGATNFQDWESTIKPFRRFKVDIREEIVALKKPDIRPTNASDHLPPAKFHELIQKKDVVVLDTRNWYETAIGTFKNAIIPKIASFQEFPKYVQKSNIPKDKTVVMFCTSGIRCEKAAEEMRNQGYEHVYQLDGGITNYLKEYPDGAWQGECFMFDHRVAVNSHLRPSTRYGLCRMCGNPGDQKASCTHCKSEHIACRSCLQQRQPYCSRACKNALQASPARTPSN